MRKQCLYERGLGWVYYEEEKVFLELRRERARKCAHMRRQKRCLCPQKAQWRCDGMCETCPYKKALETSFDATIKGTDGLTLGDTLPDGKDYETTYIEKMYCEDVLKKLDEIMPEARKIGMMRLEGKSDREIALALGINRMTMARMLARAKEALQVEL